MSSAVQDNGKKWIQTSLAVVCMLVAYILIKFFTQMGEWFELESKISYYMATMQIVSVVVALGIFVYVIKNDKTRTFLEEVYTEAIKVVWPNKNETVKHTVGIMIGVTIIGFLLGLFDLSASWLMSLLN